MSISLIVRKNAEGRNVAFVADTINKGQILAWSGKGEPEVMGVDQYHQTAPVPSFEAEQMAKQYAKAFSESDVHIRQRLPRDYMLGANQYKSAPRVVAGKSRAAKAMQGNAQRAKRISPEVRAMAEQLLAMMGR